MTKPTTPAPTPNTRKIPRQATSYMTTRDGTVPSPDDPLLEFAPVPHSRPRRNSITINRQRAFIAQLAATGIVTSAARHIGASMEALYKLRNKPGAEQFAAAWDQAVDRGVQRLEDTALARAIKGEERLVVSAGKLLGTEVRHNEALTMFFLRNRRAHRYGNDIRPGHPLYERIRAEVMLAICSENEEDVLAELNARFDQMRAREAEMAELLGEDFRPA